MKTKPLILVQLVHIEGPYKGQIQEFSEAEIAIGRHPSCQVQFPVDHAIISRKHAKIVRDGNRFKFIDHSTNGTYVNGKKTKEAILKDGDVLIFAKGGPKVSFLTQVTDQAVDAPPEPVLESKTPSRNNVDGTGPKRAPVRKKAPPKQPPRQETPPPPPPPRSEPPPTPPRSETPPTPPPPPPGDVRPSGAKVPLSVVFGPTLRSYKELPIVIGKSPDCDFQMEHPQIFDHHAQIFFHGDQYWVKDLTGKKLVLVNGSPVDTQGPLTANCEVGLTPKGPDFKFLGQGRLIEIEKTPPPVSEDNDEETSQTNDEGPKSERKKPSLIKKLWRK
jgi:pSer/pThr/pTyr-binding forkhead associated (FHA) protein